MASNTTIALKKSATPSAVPNSLANGELAINFADGKLYYKNVAGYIVQFSSATSTNYFGTVDANGTLLVADTTNDILTLSPGNSISIVGDAVNDKATIGLSNDVTVPGVLFVSAASGVEGGELRLANAKSSQSLSGNVIIDIYGNKLRIFEEAGTNRGAYIDISSATTGVGTDLLSPGSTTDSTARNWAASAFDKANNALPNTSGVSFNGNLTVSQNLTADRVFTLNNGNGENFKVGDDAWIGDTNLADTLRIKGQQDATKGYIIFGNNDGKTLGRSGSGALTYDSNTIWHAGNDGTGSTLDADLLDGQHGSYYGIATDVTAAFAKANAALSNTDGVLFNGTLTVSKNLVADKVLTSNNNNGENFRIGDDAWLGDVNIADTFRIKGVADPTRAYIIFNTSDNKALGRAGSGSLTWDGNTLWHAGNDGTGSTLDADLLDGQHGSYYGIATDVASAFAKANAANVLAFNTGVGANAYSDATFVKLIAAGQTITGNLAVTGSLTVSGNAYVLDTETLKISDPLIYLAGNNYTSDIVDIGFVANYNNGSANLHTGIFRDATIKEYYVFEGYNKEPEPNHIDTAGNNFTIAVLNATLRTSNLILGGANAITTINGKLSNTSGSLFNGTLIVSGNVAFDTPISTRITASAANVMSFFTAQAERMKLEANGMLTMLSSINMLD